MDHSQWYAWVNDGALAAFAVFMVWAVWRAIHAIGAKVWPLAERYVSSTEELHTTLRENQIAQHELCQGHQNTIKDLSDSVCTNTGIQREQCSHLKRLVDIHEKPGEAVAMSIQQTHDIHRDIEKGKRVVVHACEICRKVVRSEFPGTEQEIAPLLDNIEKIVRDSGEIGEG